MTPVIMQIKLFKARGIPEIRHNGVTFHWPSTLNVSSVVYSLFARISLGDNQFASLW